MFPTLLYVKPKFVPLQTLPYFTYKYVGIPCKLIRKINAISIFPRSFNRTIAGPGSHVLTYDYVDPVTGCSRSNTSTYTVQPAPTASTSGNETICLGDSATIMGMSSLGSTYQYRWYQQGVSTFISQQQNLTVSPTQTTN